MLVRDVADRPLVASHTGARKFAPPLLPSLPGSAAGGPCGGAPRSTVAHLPGVLLHPAAIMVQARVRSKGRRCSRDGGATGLRHVLPTSSRAPASSPSTTPSMWSPRLRRSVLSSKYPVAAANTPRSPFLTHHYLPIDAPRALHLPPPLSHGLRRREHKGRAGGGGSFLRCRPRGLQLRPSLSSPSTLSSAALPVPSSSARWTCVCSTGCARACPTGVR
jgi:hypothetical protein